MKTKIKYLPIALFLLSALLIAYPTISNIVNELCNESKINGYTSNALSYNEGKIEQLLNEAETYNQMLIQEYYDNTTNDVASSVLNNYKNILNNNSDDIMCYIEIPKINVKLPVYHNNEEALKNGAVHLEQTSFPIGGNNTHSVISAHSGYPAAKMFDDIDELGNDDEIYIYVLNKELKYKVYATEVVEPTDTTKLEIINNKDILTLVTCYPYGINSHRLLVHAERIEQSVSNETIDDTIIKSNSNLNFIPTIIVIIVLAFTLIIIIRRYKK